MPEEEERLPSLEDALKLFPKEHRPEASSVAEKYPLGFRRVAPLAAGRSSGKELFFLAFAAEKHGSEAVGHALRIREAHDRQVEESLREVKAEETNLLKARIEEMMPFIVQRDFLHTAQAVKNYGHEAAAVAVSLGYRGPDIPHAAGAVKVWPTLAAGRGGLTRLTEACRKSFVTLGEEDIPYAARALKNLPQHMSFVLSLRHERRPDELAIRGSSIPLVAWARHMAGEARTRDALNKLVDKGVNPRRIGIELLKKLGVERVPDWIHK